MIAVTMKNFILVDLCTPAETNASGNVISFIREKLSSKIQGRLIVSLQNAGLRFVMDS